MRRFWMTTVALLTVFCFCSCDLKQEEEVDEDGFLKDGKPHFVITINQMVKYPHAESIEREVECFDGNTIWINTVPLMHSKQIEKVQAIPMPDNPEYFNLKLKLNRRGKLLWSQSSIGFKHTKIAFLVDGTCYRIFKAQEPDETGEWVNVEGPFHKYVVKGIIHYAESNYKLFNPSVDDL